MRQRTLHPLTARQDPWLDYWLSQCLLLCSLTQPHPLQHPLACTLLIKPVCSSPDCQSFPAHVAPVLTPLFLPFPSLSFPTSSVLVELFKLKTELGCVEEKTQRSATSIFVCHLSHYFHCSATAARVLRKLRPLWSLPHGAGADIFLSCLPLKCPFCVSYW